MSSWPRARSRPRTRTADFRGGVRVVAFAVMALLVLASCGGDQVTPDADVPAALVIHSGDGQTANTGTEAGEPVRVRVTGQSGSGVSGVSVAFQVTVGGGSVPSSSAVTDANGIASPGRWTMGAPGPQELRASVPGLDPVVFHATAQGIPAEIAIVAGADQEAPVATAVPVVPEVLVTDASGVPLAGIRVAFTTAAGATVANPEANTNAQGRAGPGAWTLGTATGVYRLFASVDGDSIKGNPLRFEAVAVAGPAARIVAVAGDGQESEIRLPVTVAPVIRVEDAHGNPAADVAVSFSASGDSEVIPTETMTDSAGHAAVDKWILGTTAGATYRLTAGVAGGGGTAEPLVFSATATPAVYDIEIVHVSASLLTDSQRRAFEKAEEYWERAITGNLAWSTVRKPALEHCLARNDITEEIPGDRVVDDLLIYVQIKEIDGPAGVFGGAGPCQIRVGSSLPVVGVMFFDLGDMDGLESNGHLGGTILHEMAHVIGFGTLWDHLGLLQDPAGHGRSANTHFVGDSAVAAFDRIRGDNYTKSDLVPVQNLGGDGVWNGHWREFVFRSELMTPFPDRGHNPLSVVSLASFVDVGYEGVDYSMADEFVLPPPLYPMAEGARAGAEEGAIDLSGDILRMPLMVVDREGNVVRVIPPERR
ncbi:MAG: hypothetical protein OXU74_14300 [Gemmatimonadota bacterium]|nr:hypothetical protein [Gemmatimonadota bacterium]